MAAISKHILSKSTFMYGCQCPKRLWLHKFMPSVEVLVVLDLSPNNGAGVAKEITEIEHLPQYGGTATK